MTAPNHDLKVIRGGVAQLDVRHAEPRLDERDVNARWRGSRPTCPATPRTQVERLVALVRQP